MKKNKIKFDVKFSNMPFLNVRNEFKINYRFVNSNSLDTYLALPHGPYVTPYGTWTASLETLLTIVLQRAILGVESYLPIALKCKAHDLLVATDELVGEIDNAHGANNLFHRIPKSIDPSLSLCTSDNGLYQETLDFYEFVRNPLFHGREISEVTPESFRASFEHIRRIYQWIDTWYKSEAQQSFKQAGA